MIAADVVGRRAASFLGERVWCAVPLSRGPHPQLLAFAWLPLWLPLRVAGAGPLTVILATLAVCGALLATSALWRRGVVLARTDSELVVLRVGLWSYATPRGVWERLPLDMPRAIGPSSWMYRPVNLGYRRFWVHDRYGRLAEWIVQMSAPHPPPWHGRDEVRT
jgi:hypothetical protein